MGHVTPSGPNVPPHAPQGPGAGHPSPPGAPTPPNGGPPRPPQGPPNMPTGGHPAMGPGQPGAHPQGPPPGAPTPPPGAPAGVPRPPQGPPEPAAEQPVFPPDAMGATQNLNAVPAAPTGPKASARPLYRDEVPEDDGADTAQFDVQSMRDYDDYDDYYDDDRGAPRDKRKRNILLGSGFAVLLLLVGGGVFLIASGGLGSGGSGDAVNVSDEADDPGALDVEALFPEEVEVDGQGTFSRVAVEDTDDCATGTHGDYGQALTENDCRQLIRASYLSEDQNHAVTVGIAAMPRADEAEEAMNAQDLIAAEWFAGLPGEEGSPAERLGYSGGHGSSGQWGRYLVFSLAANSDGSGEEESEATELRDIGEGFVETAYESLADDRA